MKKITPALLAILFLISCGNKKKLPDVSGIKVDIPIERFDRSFFVMDTTRLEAGLVRLKQEHPGFYDDFMKQILGVSGSPTDTMTLLVTANFFRGYAPIYDSVKKTYNDLDWFRKELEKGFQYVKYYFPTYKTGRAIFFLGPFDAPGVASTGNGLAIGLQQYAGSDFSVYQLPEMIDMFPLYISRRFSKEYMAANCMKAVVLELFPDQSKGKPLIEQMVEKGKQWWLLDQFLPNAPDSVKTGYSKHQLDWCRKNEGLIWAEIVRNEDLNSLNPAVIQTYIGEGPFTQGMPQEDSPGNIGQWLGWQILKKYLSKNPSLKPEEIMKTPARKIIEEAKYKPK
ncbi:MAG: hypothetical protein KA229_04450 [Chitinophagaceae bacterium]|nr:hypothetical protein [Chitinophagaceae bacterium]